MQKFLLSTVSALALGFAATAAMASGSTSYVTQNGDNQHATIDQSGGSSDVVGTSGTPFLQQDGAGTGSNVVTITQTGSGNTVGTDTANYPAGAFQSGTSNRATIEQNGKNSDVELQQAGTGNGPTGVPYSDDFWSNDADAGSIVQDSTAKGSKVILSQNGTDNLFNIGQGGTDNAVTATQSGENMLWIRQGTSSPDVWYAPLTPGAATLSNSTITVAQTGGGAGGDTNYAALAQGGGHLNSIGVTQNGAANNTDVNQSGSSNIFISDQESNPADTWATENFAGSENGDGSPAGDLPISQIGTSNYVNILQTGFSNSVGGSQTGNLNTLNSNQAGENNVLTFLQSGGGDTIGNTQSGSVNTALLTQSGASNSITGVQYGTGVLNSATVTQTTASNTASYNQNGGGHTLSITQ